MGPSGRGRGSFGEIGPETRCYRRVLLHDTCRIPPSPPARIVLHKVRAYAAATSPQPASAGRPLRLRARSGGGVPSADASVRKRLKRQKEQRERDVSFIYPHASVLLVKKREDTGALSPNLLPVSLRFSIDFSDKVRNHFSTLLHPLLLPSLPCLSLSLSLPLSHISGRTQPLIDV